MLSSFGSWSWMSCFFLVWVSSCCRWWQNVGCVFAIFPVKCKIVTSPSDLNRGSGGLMVRSGCPPAVPVLWQAPCVSEFGVHLAELTVDPRGALAIRQVRKSYASGETVAFTYLGNAVPKWPRCRFWPLYALFLLSSWPQSSWSSMWRFTGALSQRSSGHQRPLTGCSIPLSLSRSPSLPFLMLQKQEAHRVTCIQQQQQPEK